MSAEMYCGMAILAMVLHGRDARATLASPKKTFAISGFGLDCRHLHAEEAMICREQSKW
jgi:hypothetical protein